MRASPRLRQGVIGEEPGALALAVGLHRAAHPLHLATRRDPSAADHLDALVPGVAWGTCADIGAQCDLIWLGAPAHRLAECADELARAGVFRPGQLVAHASPGVGIEPLSPAEACGATVLALTPLLPVAATSLGVDALAQATLAVCARAPFVPLAQALALEVGAQPLPIRDDQAPLIAAAGHLVGDHLGVLVSAAARILSQLGVDDPAKLLAPAAHAGVESAFVVAQPASPLDPAVARALEGAFDRLALTGLDDDDPDVADSLDDVRELMTSLEAHVSRHCGSR